MSTVAPAAWPVRLTGLLDDAAVFPPGDLPLPDAVRAHREHRRGRHAALVGPLVLPATALPRLADLLTPAVDDDPLAIALTVPSPEAAEGALARAVEIAGVEVRSLEVALPAATDEGPAGVAGAAGARAALRHLDAIAELAPSLAISVELPRDARRPHLVEALAGTGLRAKLRTGGLTADLFPDAAELAAAVVALARAEVPFKATAGLHHALPTADPALGVVQHGFVTLLLAAEAAAAGAEADEVAGLLREQRADVVRDRFAATRGGDPAASAGSPPARPFTSFGTCSIAEPVAELVALGLLEEPR
ncbi:hypothetical protein [Nocardioides sp.]|uniref:hypothetical protein n=1 Tax=Nocardioides sp. TaxID=35761 RepID=UPI0035198E6B